MNELLQKHGCSNVFSVPEGLRELMSDISREVLREQPTNVLEFIANYLSVLLITREHGVLALRILEDLCDCKPSVSEHLMALGMERDQADMLAQVMKEEIEEFEPIEGKEKVKEMQIMKKVLTRSVLDEDMAAKVCQVARNAYRDYWYRKKLLEKSIKVQSDEPWEIAAQHTLELYKKTKPSFSELNRATEKIQAAYRGYHVRKNLLSHLKPKRKKQGPKVELLGPPIDTAESREIDLGPIIDVKVREDNVDDMFDEYAGEELGLRYDPMKTITHVEDEDFLQPVVSQDSRAVSHADDLQLTRSLATGMHSTKSVAQGLQSTKSMAKGLQSTKSLAHGLQSTKSMAQGLQSTKSLAQGLQSTKSMAEGLQSTKSLAQGLQSTKSMTQELQSTKSMAQGLQSTKSLAQGLQSTKGMVEGLASTKSMVGVDATSKMSRPEEVEGPRQSRLASQIPEQARQSRLQSQMSTAGRTDPELHRISFAEHSPEVIPDLAEHGEIDGVKTNEVMGQQDVSEVPEEPGVEPAIAVEGEPAQEVPEDIPDDRTEGDGESGPTASMPSSAPDTADNTDFEEAGDTTGEDEGE